MKKFLLTIAATAIMGVTTMADTAVTVYSNGNEVTDKGVIVEGRTLVPVRGIFEYMGYDVDWNAETKTATLTNSEKNITIELTNGDEEFYVNGESIQPDVPQQIINGRFMLPLRAVGDSVGAEIEWDGENKIARIDENTKADEENEIDESIAKAFKIEVEEDFDPSTIDESQINIIEF
jgi:hypothetical protein